jgi:pseudouridine-5'-phosphate glycosidase
VPAQDQTQTQVNRAGPHAVALESTLLLHGVPRHAALPLAEELDAIITGHGATPATVAVLHGRPIVGLTRQELATLLRATNIPKANTGNLGVLMHRRSHAATTVSTTMELAADAGVRVFATGGIGGVHKGYGDQWDVSADLMALTRFPVAVVASGVKNLLDVVSTREMLETLGVPVIGFGTDRFPAFYLRDSAAGVDARFDDPEELAAFLAAELARTGRGVLVCNPIPRESELDPEAWSVWIARAEAMARAAGATGRAVTPAVLAALHEVSDGATLTANLALVRSNAALAARLAAARTV